VKPVLTPGVLQQYLILVTVRGAYRENRTVPFPHQVLIADEILQIKAAGYV